MVAEERREDYIMDTLEIIKRCLRGKRDYFGVNLYAESRNHDSCGCKDPLPEEPCIPVHEYLIYIDLPEGTDSYRIKKLLPISIKQETPGGIRVLLIRVLSTDNNMEIIENIEEASTITHLSLESYISMYLNRVIRAFTEGEI